MAAIQRPASLPARAQRKFGGRILLPMVALLVVAGAMLQVNQFSAVTGTGYEIEDLKRERAAKQAANHDQEAEVARLSSLARVDIEARVRLGMVPATRVTHLWINGTVPDHQTLPTRYLPPAAAAEDDPDDPSLIERLMELLPF